MTAEEKNMQSKIKSALALAPFLPASVKALLLEVGAELDQLRAELNLVKSHQSKEQ